MQLFISDIKHFINENSNQEMNEFIEPLQEAIKDLDELTQNILSKTNQNIEILGSAANDYLHIFGYTAMAFVWAKMAKVSLANMHEDQTFHESKLLTARYYFAKLLPKRLSLIALINSGSEPLFNICDEMF